MVNTLFKSQVSRKASSWNREEKIPKTVEIKAIGHGKDPAGTMTGVFPRASARKGEEWGRSNEIRVKSCILHFVIKTFFSFVSVTLGLYV